MRTRYLCGCGENKLTYPIEELFFCETCKDVKCPQCIDYEIITRYCPCCLHEMTQTSARASTNKCVRNCLMCPKCESAIKPIARENETFVLKCSYCEWKCEHTFNKNASLSHQVRMLRREAEPNNFERIQEFIRKIQQSQGEIFGENRGEKEDNREDLREEQPQSVDLPKLCPLRGKSLKKCRACQNVLSRPDSKPSSKSFKPKRLAMNYVPSLKLESYVPTSSTASISSGLKKDYFLLTVTNVLTQPTQVWIGAPEVNGGHTTIAVPDFILGAASKTWDEQSLAEQVPQRHIVRETKVAQRVFMERRTNVPTGMHDAGRNWVTVPIECQEIKEISLLVTFILNQEKIQVWCQFHP